MVQTKLEYYTETHLNWQEVYLEMKKKADVECGIY